jgi:PHD/YefM family antitoxin component YafN of YafNO toxin-antitoxin module
MIELHPQIIEKNGRRESVLLPYEEFEALREIAEDQEDLHDLHAAKARNENDETVSLEEVERRFGLRTS